MSNQDWVKPALLKLAKLLDLPDDWCGHPSFAVKPECALSALEFLRKEVPLACQPADISATVDGGICLWWGACSVYVRIFFGPKGISEFVIVDGRECAVNEALLTLAIRLSQNQPETGG